MNESITNDSDLTL